MQTYFSTFLTGFSDLIGNAVKNKVKDVEIVDISDGLIIYKTNAAVEYIKSIRLFNNSFILLKTIQNSNSTDVNGMLKETAYDKKLEEKITSVTAKKKQTFRIVIKENQIITADKSLVKKLEDKIIKIKNLQVDRSNPDIEFWFLLRREGFAVFGLRLTRHLSYEKSLQKGELYPELAYILSLVSEPKITDIFLDPCCGSGSIPLQRITLPYVQVLAGDTDPKLVAKLRVKTNNFKKKIIIGRWDCTYLKTFKDNSVDKIVTDPPWGIHTGKQLDLPKFYYEMLTEFYRVLKPDSLLVLLIGKKELFEEVLSKFNSKLVLVKRYDTLVSGQKAGVYKIKKEQ